MAKCSIHPMTDLSTTGTCWACEVEKHKPPGGWPTWWTPVQTIAVVPCPECERLTKERDAALASLKSARALLAEWRRTPFFETHAAWETWVLQFGARVDSALSEGRKS